MNDELVAIDNMRLGSISVTNPHDVIVMASSIAKELAGIVKDNNLSRKIQGREYVFVEGWSTMGAMLGVLPREVFTHRLDDGSYEATVELIRISDNAVIGRASAYVGMDEKDRNGNQTWGIRPEYARRSMAITRATGKAYRLGFSWIMGLAGYAPTPAEEMDGIIDGEMRDVTQENKDVIRKAQANSEKVMAKVSTPPPPIAFPEEEPIKAEDHPAFKFCELHRNDMPKHEKDGRIWYSHKLPDGTWCKGVSEKSPTQSGA